jgi:hypothetical protein
VSTIVNNDYKDLLREFNDADVEYMVVGAHALASHGHPRYSEDFDVWVQPTPENAARVYKALATFGAPMERISVEDFVSDDLIFQIGVAPVRIDVITSISGVTWDEAWPESVPAFYGDVPVRVLGRKQLIANKRASGRPKDLIDLQTLEGDTR